MVVTTDRQRKVDAFRLLYGAVTLPFGAALGVMLTNLGTGLGERMLSAGDTLLLAFGLSAFGLFFAAMSLVCEAIIRERLRLSVLNVTVIAVAGFLCVVRMPVEVLGINFRLWLSVMGAWIGCCLILCALCRFMDIKKSVFR